MTRSAPLIGLVAAMTAITPTSAPTAAAGTPTTPDDTRPNVITILADDLGYGDTSLYGGTIDTPNIDRLAASGVTFTDGYVGSPVCSPSRWSLLSGQEAPRIGGDNNTIVRRHTLPEFGPEIPSLAGELHDAGYHTMAIGKWDLSGITRNATEEEVPEHPNLPHQVGFDEYWGVLAGISPYCPQNDPHTFGLDPATGTYHKERPTEYLTDEFTRRAVDYLDQRQADDSQPFFLYLAYNAPHNPFETRTHCDNPPRDDVDERRRRFEEMVRIMDEGIGQVLDALDPGTRRNTIITFLSDNGPQHGWRTGPLRGRKSTVFEGGVRVPFVTAWPGHLPAGVVSGTPVRSHDLAPTYLTAAGVPHDPDRYPGSDLVTRVVDGTGDGPYVWRYYNDSGPTGAIAIGTTRLAVRDGRWKWVHDIRPDGTGNEYLFDLATDPGEQHDLADDPDQLDRTRRMRQLYRDWAATVDHRVPLEQFRNATRRPDGTSFVGGEWVGDEQGLHATAPVDGTAPGTALMPGTYHRDDRTGVEVELGGDGARGGLVVRGSLEPDGRLTGYLVSLTHQQVVVSRFENGHRTVLGSAPVTVTGRPRLDVTMTGGRLVVRLAHRPVLTVTDDDALPGGSTGLRVEAGTVTFQHLVSRARG